MKKLATIALLCLFPVLLLADVSWITVSGTSPGYTGLPTMCTMPNGSILLVWCEGTSENNADCILKQCVGTSWSSWGSPSTVVVATEGKSLGMSCLFTVSTRVYLFYSLRDTITEYVDNYYIYTDNNASSWSEPALFKAASEDRLLLNDGATTLSDGSYIFPVTRCSIPPATGTYYQNFWKCPSDGDPSDPTDWTEITGPHLTDHNLCEGTLMELEPGHVLCYMRDETTPDAYAFYKAESTDYGATWGTPTAVSGLQSTRNHQKLMSVSNGTENYRGLLLFDNGDDDYVHRRWGDITNSDAQWVSNLQLQYHTGNNRYPVATQYGDYLAYAWMWGDGPRGTETAIHVWGEHIPGQMDFGSGAAARFFNKDSTPDAFTFSDVTSADISTIYTHDAKTLAGTTIDAAISVTGGEYKIAGGTWKTASGYISAGQTYQLRLTTDDLYGYTNDAILSIGGVSDTFSVTTPIGPELVPAMASENWTATDDWSIAYGGLHCSTGGGTITPSGTFTIIPGRRYKVEITSSITTGSVTYTLGGEAGTTITTSGTITDYITASTSGKIIFTGHTANVTIYPVSVKEDN